VVRLHRELVELRGNLRREVEPYAGHAMTVSVSESGASTYERDIGGVYVWVDREADAGLATDDAVLQRFQAREVWRRLAVAAARGWAVAWHTHMGNVNLASGGESVPGPFGYTGLRLDGQLETSPASDAFERPSYWAWQRFAALLRGVDATTGEPADWRARFVPSGQGPLTNFGQDLDPADWDDTLVMVEFDLGGGQEFAGEPWYYAYVILRDPTSANIRVPADKNDLFPFPDDPAPPELTLQNSEGRRVIRLPTVPMYSVMASTGGTVDFPTSVPYVATPNDWGTTYELVTESDSEVRLTVYAHGPLDATGLDVDRALGDPILLLCKGRLSL
jgi:hypothetical protein